MVGVVTEVFEVIVLLIGRLLQNPEFRNQVSFS